MVILVTVMLAVVLWKVLGCCDDADADAEAKGLMRRGAEGDREASRRVVAESLEDLAKSDIHEDYIGDGGEERRTRGGAVQYVGTGRTRRWRRGGRESNGAIIMA